MHPAGVMEVGDGNGLFAELGARVPHAVEEDNHHADAVLVGDGEKLVDAIEQPLRVLLPEQIVQKDTDRVEAQTLGEGEFLVDGVEIEGFRLPHLQLVDGGAGDEVAPDEPGLVGVPVVGLLLGPAPGRLLGAGDKVAVQAETRDDNEAMKKGHGRNMVAKTRRRSRKLSQGCCTAGLFQG